MSTRSRLNRLGQSVSRHADPQSQSRACTRRRASAHDTRIDRRGRRCAANPARSPLRHRKVVREGADAYSHHARRTMSKAWATDQTYFFLAGSEASQESSETNCKVFRGRTAPGSDLHVILWRCRGRRAVSEMLRTFILLSCNECVQGGKEYAWSVRF